MTRDHAKPTPRDAPAAAAPDPKLEALAAGKHAGTVKFDERGNAIWHFAEASATSSGDASSARKRLESPGLAIADDAEGRGLLKANPLGTLKGYNPYESGQLATPSADKRKKRKDLRRLSEWMKLRKQAVKNKEEP